MVDQYRIRSKGVGSIQRNLYWQELKRVSVLVPPKEEQDQIVRYLDLLLITMNQSFDSWLSEANQAAERKTTNDH